MAGSPRIGSERRTSACPRRDCAADTNHHGATPTFRCGRALCFLNLDLATHLSRRVRVRSQSPDPEESASGDLDLPSRLNHLPPEHGEKSGIRQGRHLEDRLVDAQRGLLLERVQQRRRSLSL